MKGEAARQNIRNQIFALILSSNGTMLFVESEDIKPGMRLAKPVYNRNGVLLFDRSTKYREPDEFRIDWNFYSGAGRTAAANYKRRTGI